MNDQISPSVLRAAAEQFRELGIAVIEGFASETEVADMRSTMRSMVLGWWEQESMAEKGDPKDPWASEGAAVPGDAPTFEEGEQALRPRRRSIRSKSRGVAASLGAAARAVAPAVRHLIA